jgi:hypothetical protein
MDSFDALIAKLEAIADDTRRDLTIAATQLRRWPSPRTLHWKPAAFLVPTTWARCNYTHSPQPNKTPQPPRR